MSFVYLASPYTNYHEGYDAAFREAASISAVLTEAGLTIFSPVVHFHPISQRTRRHSHAFWMRRCRPFMEASSYMIVAQIAGWDTSKGIFEEREFFQKMRRHVRYLGWPLPPSTAKDIRQLRWLVGLPLGEDYSPTSIAFSLKGKRLA